MRVGSQLEKEERLCRNQVVMEDGSRMVAGWQDERYCVQSEMEYVASNPPQSYLGMFHSIIPTRKVDASRAVSRRL